MERLTHTNKGMAWYKSDLLLLEPCELSIPQIAEVIRHLAAYEDTGLTPEEVKEKVRQLDTIVERYGLYHDGRGDAILELLKACKEGRVLQYVPGDTVYDRFGMAWTVTSSEIHKFGDGPLRYLYRCGHPGTDDYCALYAEEICQKPEAGL